MVSGSPDDRQCNKGRMLSVVQHMKKGRPVIRASSERLLRPEVRVRIGEGGSGDIHADPVSRGKQVRNVAHRDPVLSCRSLRHILRFRLRITETEPQLSRGYPDRRAVGTDVGETDVKVSVLGVAPEPDLRADGARELRVRSLRLSSVHKHILTFLDAAEIPVHLEESGKLRRHRVHGIVKDRVLTGRVPAALSGRSAFLRELSGS